MESLVEVMLPDGISADDGFQADHTAWNLGGMLIVEQRVPAHSYARSAASLRASPIDHWYAGMLRCGRAWTEVDGLVAESEPGKAEFRSLGHPFRGRITESEAIFLYMPRDLFADTPGILDMANNAILSDNLAKLLIEYVSGLEATLNSLVAEDLPRIVHTVRDMIINCLSSPAEHVTVEQQAGLGLMERARQHIHRNLHSPKLTPDDLCGVLGISRTRLYQLFEPSGGVLHYIRRRRLLAAHTALSDPANNQRILDIAEAVGFDSAANFSRAFSQEFGYSPREARSAIAPGPLAHAASHAEPEESSSFEAWLKLLGN
ncbi:helix-turn-helix domain-containing protein [Phyllobacterium phragmitis]|nr:helix-turn-helix domain-containing protein [Phyllobacterium phragmitis]